MNLAEKMKKTADNFKNPEHCIEVMKAGLTKDIERVAKNGGYEIQFHYHKSDIVKVICDYFEKQGFKIIENSGFIANSYIISWGE